MKKLLTIIGLLILFSFCGPSAEEMARIEYEKSHHSEINTEVTKTSKIKLVEETYVNGYCYQIISVNGIEYMTNCQGGIVKLE